MISLRHLHEKVNLAYNMDTLWFWIEGTWILFLDGYWAHTEDCLVFVISHYTQKSFGFLTHTGIWFYEHELQT